MSGNRLSRIGRETKKLKKKKTSDDGYEDVLKRKKFFFGTMFGVPKLLLLLVLG